MTAARQANAESRAFGGVTATAASGVPGAHADSYTAEPLTTCSLEIFLSRLHGRVRARTTAARQNPIVGFGQARRVLSKDLPSADGTAEHIVVPSPPVVAASSVRGERTCKLGRADKQDVVPNTLRAHLGDEAAQRAVDFAEPHLERLRHLVVHVEAAGGDEEDLALRLHGRARLDQLGHLLKLARDARGGKGRLEGHVFEQLA
mmetsp:Transcript_18242/g.41800  ORF Transcript_18242/g.41800 Transcript_18242/m.41800 type:complete len:204 (-) Transcript_18242:2196-2807(-)